jgi:alkyldihydroxyacetonephosphate synthase
MTDAPLGNRHPSLWGDPEQTPTAAEVRDVRELLAGRFADADLGWYSGIDWRRVKVPTPRLPIPDALAAFTTDTGPARLLHAVGRSFTDLVRARRGDYGTPPDAVAMPRTAAEVAAVLDWCADAGAACIPFGGGTSVVGGIAPGETDQPVVTLQTRAMDRVLDIDAVSQAACIQAGASGPVLEEQLGREGLSLRFYPQSFEFSTLGGWIATRAGGHFATGPTHIDDLVESIDAITPRGLWSSARLPASGAGPSPDRMLLGSEGTLGVITQAWVRVQPRPNHRAGRAVQFGSFAAGADAVRALAQSGLQPAGCRLLDPTEAALNSAGDGTAAVLVLGFESTWRPVDHDLDLALELCGDAGGVALPERPRGPSEQWRSSFLRAPYLRDALIGLGMVVETFETATTWDRFGELHAAVIDATQEAVARVCGDGIVTCRLTHAYPDGAAPYFTVIAPGSRRAEAQQWLEIKLAASEALAGAGGTITHHHAVGRDHRPWYDRQRPDLFAAALTAAKAAVDPTGMMNPGVLVDQSA